MRPLLRRLLRALAPLLLVPAALACPPPAAPATPAELQAAERSDRGFLWALQRDGRTSYLYGTLHVGKPAWTRLGPKVAAAFAATDVLALELDPADPGTAAALTAPAEAGAPPLPPALAERLARRIEAACVPRGPFAALPPPLQVALLGVFEARWLGLDASFSQELTLAFRAREAGRPLLALETAALQRGLFAPDAQGAELQTLVEHGLAELESGAMRQSIGKLAAAWEQGDLATIERYESWCGCVATESDRIALRALNDDRNPALAERIDALHREGRRVFAAVGALHMTGPQALPALLAARGYAVRRVAF